MNLLTPADVDKIMRKKLKTTNFEIVDYHIVKPQGDSFGFLSTCNTLKIKVKYQSKESEFRFFAKHFLHGNEYHKKLMIKARVVFKEAYTYSAVLPQIDKYAQKKFHPEFYFANEDIIVLEDMAELGYRVEDVNSLFDLERCKSALECLAEMHVASIACEIKENVNLSEEHSAVNFPTFLSLDESHPGSKFVTASIEAMKEVFKKYFPHLTDEVVQEALSIIRNVPHNSQMSKTDLNVFSHRDMWSNNIMFRKEKEGKGYSVCLIDFQLVQFCPPAMDALQTIFTSTSPELRNSKNGLELLLTHYHKHLSNGLSYHNIDINSVLTWEQFKNSVDRLLPTMLGTSVMYNHFTTIPGHVLEPIFLDPLKHQQLWEGSRTNIVMELMESNSIYRERLIGTLNDLISFVTCK